MNDESGLYRRVEESERGLRNGLGWQAFGLWNGHLEAPSLLSIKSARPKYSFQIKTQGDSGQLGFAQN